MHARETTNHRSRAEVHDAGWVHDSSRRLRARQSLTNAEGRHGLILFFNSRGRATRGFKASPAGNTFEVNREDSDRQQALVAFETS